jgi:hypothetical protein
MYPGFMGKPTAIPSRTSNCHRDECVGVAGVECALVDLFLDQIPAVLNLGDKFC